MKRRSFMQIVASLFAVGAVPVVVNAEPQPFIRFTLTEDLRAPEMDDPADLLPAGKPCGKGIALWNAKREMYVVAQVECA